MAIEIVHDLKTIRTNPRLMKHKGTGATIMTLHDHEATSGYICLSGKDAGRIVRNDKDTQIDWEAFDDLKGSVTLWNSN